MVATMHEALEPLEEDTPIARGWSAPDAGEAAQSSASKTLAVLEVLGRSPDATVGVTEVAAEIGVPKSTAHRLLKTLEQHGFVGRSGTRYRVGGSLFELAQAAAWSEFGELREVAPEPLSWLFERSDAIAAHLAVLSGPSVLYLEKVTRPEGTRLPSRVGGRFPATCTALGKAILSRSAPAEIQRVLDGPMARVTPYSVVMRRQFVEQLRLAAQRGYAVEREEACQGTLCVAAPVVRDGRAIAAVSMCVPTLGMGRAAEQRLGSFGRLTVEAANRVRALLPVA